MVNTYSIQFNNRAMLTISHHRQINDFTEEILLERLIIDISIIHIRHKIGIFIKLLWEDSRAMAVEAQKYCEYKTMKNYKLHSLTLYEDKMIPLSELIISSPPHDTSLSSIKSIRGMDEQKTLEKECNSNARLRMVVIESSCK